MDAYAFARTVKRQSDNNFRAKVTSARVNQPNARYRRAFIAQSAY
jgi:hypothetical protein